jgi:hypothetical protein
VGSESVSQRFDRLVVRAVSLDEDLDLLAERPGLLLLADKGLRLRRAGCLPAGPRRGAATPVLPQPHPRPGQALLAPIRQLIESVYDTFKGQLDVELHGGRSLTGVTVRVAQRLLALTAAIWHNRATAQPITRSLIAYDHRPASDLLV